MCRIRSIRDAAKLFREMDPNTEITEATIRKMIAEGTIPAKKTGSKYLVNVDLILDMFGGVPADGTIKTAFSVGNCVIEK